MSKQPKADQSSQSQSNSTSTAGQIPSTHEPSGEYREALYALASSRGHSGDHDNDWRDK